MSYTKFDIAGQSVGIKFGYLSYKTIVSDKNRSLMFDDDGNVLEAGLAKIIHSGYVNNCVIKNVEAVLTIDDFAKQVDEMVVTPEGVEKLKEVIVLWSESNEVKEAAKKITDAEKKSPLTSESSVTESNLSVTDNLE